MIDLGTLLRCPGCGGGLALRATEATCGSCRRAFAIADGIPILVGRQAEHSRAQASHFDEEEDSEFEITRPRGTAALYAWTLEEKFRRSVDAIQEVVTDGTALTICGGSGMEAELLARRGAEVVCSDISLGAARRARERSRRHLVPLVVVVADAERLPFRDGAFDLVYVHDGLHHLERPDLALLEMARVARAAISLTEPANAALTRLAVRLGLALSREPAGNRVLRFELTVLVEQLRSLGFHVVRAERYGLYYRHRPGPISHFLSRPRLFPLATRAIQDANALAGGIGNKLTVQAVRK